MPVIVTSRQMAAQQVFLVGVLVLFGVTDTPAMTTVGVLEVWRFANYSSANIVIGHVILNDVKDLGTWSPKCQFTSTVGYRGRISGHTCSYPTEGTRLRLEFGSPTQEDGQGRYVCGNGGLDPGARFNCNPSYTTEAKNAAAPGSSSVALLVLLTGLALYVIESHQRRLSAFEQAC